MSITPHSSPESANAAAETFPQDFGRYILTERIGSGGMAEIFRALTLGTEGFRRVLVVKRIRKSLDSSSEFLRMFFDEAKISALLNHPYIVQIYDFGQIEGAYFLAMEHVDGRDLGSVLRRLSRLRARMHPSTVALIALEVAQGLHYAHTLHSADDQPFNIVHRDVNPSNVMLLRTGTVKILDFGIAKASAAAGKAQTRATVIKGKLGYLSPEQGRCERLDGRSDVFSLGTTMWEMLAGEKLFTGKTDFERIKNVLEAPIRPPGERQSGIPSDLDRIVMRALERDLARRYRSAEELADDLEAFLRKQPAESQAIKKLIGHLFDGNEVRNTTSLPAVSMPTAVTKINTESRSVADSSATPPPSSSRASAIVAKRRSRRFGAMAWSGAASLVIAVAAVTLAGRASQTPSLAVASPAAPAVASAASEVRLEVGSEPSGASVTGSHGFLGTTPLVIRLPVSVEVEALRFDKPGFESQVYEVHPRGSGLVFVELQPGPEGAGSAQDGLEHHR